MSLPIRRIITSQPQVATLLDSRVVAAACAGIGSFELVTKRPLTFSSTSPTRSIVPTTEGKTFDHVVTNPLFTAAIPSYLTKVDNRSNFIACGHSRVGSSAPSIFSQVMVAGGGSGYGWRAGVGYASETQVNIGIGGNWAGYTLNSISVLVTLPRSRFGSFHWAISVNSVANTCNMFIDGNEVYSGTITSAIDPVQMTGSIGAFGVCGDITTPIMFGAVLSGHNPVLAKTISRNVYSLFTSVDTPIFVGLVGAISSITLTTASDSSANASATAIITTGVFAKTDISTTGWTGVPDNTVISNNINEETSSTAEYIQSPPITGSQGPADFDLNNSLGVGTWEIDATFKYTLSAASVKFTLLNSGGSPLGDSGWIAASSVFAGYTPTITISSGTATKIRVEVQ